MEALNALLEDDGDDDALPRFSGRELITQILPYYGRYKRQLALAVGILLTVIGLGLLAPFLLGQIVDALLTFVNRDGLVDLTYRDRLLGPTASYGDRYRLEDLERELVEYGAIEFHRRRALPSQIRLAPWAT